MCGVISSRICVVDSHRVSAPVYFKKRGMTIASGFPGVAQDLPLDLCRDIDSSTTQFVSRIDELEKLSTDNRIWKQQLVGISIVTAQQAKDWGFSGVMLRDYATRRH